MYETQAIFVNGIYFTIKLKLLHNTLNGTLHNLSKISGRFSLFGSGIEIEVARGFEKLFFN